MPVLSRVQRGNDEGAGLTYPLYRSEEDYDITFDQLDPKKTETFFEQYLNKQIYVTRKDKDSSQKDARQDGDNNLNNGYPNKLQSRSALNTFTTENSKTGTDSMNATSFEKTVGRDNKGQAEQYLTLDHSDALAYQNSQQTHYRGMQEFGDRASLQQVSLTPLRRGGDKSSHYLSQRNIQNYKNNPNGKIYNQEKLMMFI